MRIFAWLMLLLFVPGSARAEIAAPLAGVIVTPDRSVRVVAGVGGALVVGDVLATGAQSAAGSSKLTVIKLDLALRVNGVDFDAPAGPAIFGFTREGDTAFAYFPATGELMRIRDAAVEAMPVFLDGDVVALAGALTVYVRRDDGIHAVAVRVSDGAVESDTALGIDTVGMAAFADGSMLYARDSSVVMRTAEGMESSRETPGPVLSLAVMGEGWVHAQLSGESLAIRVSDASPRCFRLAGEVRP